MAMEQVGLGVKLMFDGSRAVTGIGRVDRAFQGLGQRMNQMRQGLSQITGGIGRLTMATAPLSAGFAWGMSKAMDFEQAMANVGSVTLATAEDMAAMEITAKRLGATTAFSATQAAEAMEFLGRAGFDTQQIISAIPAVMNMAAADSMGLAEAADITANIMKSMDIKASDVANRLTGKLAPAISEMAAQWRAAGVEMTAAEHIVDVLALTSARSNTNVSMLGEAYRYVGNTAKNTGRSIEETSAALGMLANAGLKASMGGTALRTMMVKLAKPGKEVLDIFGGSKGWTNVIEDSSGKMRPLPDIIATISNKLGTLKSDTQKMALIQEMFGLRGQDAYNSLATAGKRSTNELMAALQTSSAMMDENGNMIGAAALMAKRRLSTLKGAFTLLTSALEGFAIETAGSFIPGLTNMTTSITAFVGDVAVALQFLNMDSRNVTAEMRAAWEKIPAPIRSVAEGIKEGIDTIIGLASRIKTQFIQPIVSWLGGMEGDTTKTFAKWATYIAIAATALVPLLGGLLMIGMAISGLGGIIAGIASIASAAFWPVIVVIGLAVAAIIAFKKENESFAEFAVRAWNWIKQSAQAFAQGFMSMWGGISPAIDSLKQSFQVLWEAIKGVLQEFGIMAAESVGQQSFWQTFGEYVGMAAMFLIAVADAAVLVASFLVTMLEPAVKIVIMAIKVWWETMKLVVSIIMDPIGAFKAMASAVISIHMALFAWLVNAFTVAFNYVKEFIIMTITIAANWISSKLGSAAQAAVAAIQAAFATAKSAILGPIQAGVTAALAVLQGMLNNPVVNAAKGLFNWARGGGPSPGGGGVTSGTGSNVSTSAGGEFPDMTAAVARAGGLSVERQARAHGSGAGNPESQRPGAGGGGPITVNSKLYIDGREIMIAYGQAQVEHSERAGRSMTPVHKRSMNQMGAV
jgi:TP901 family phage tail tape measure protein